MMMEDDDEPLELTEEVPDDDTADAELSMEDLMASFGATDEEEEEEVYVPPPPPPPPPPRPRPPPPPPPPPPRARTPEQDGLMSPVSRQAASMAFSRLTGDMPIGIRTVEQLLMELMRPILKEWLDENLPNLVEELVREEIDRVVRGSRGDR
jgi:uncharacterized protein